ncbi:uncharacterized protein [Parasteatoda tepidariorum]|uniref:uncharacterized protein n=1 Tax=Parasteatoda tepidariorum TaxID=114398 RepID=UPI00077FA2E1|nr:uncharacterized protein LOC107449709 isoform X2 [Parasteatoda tepidariorum]XP_015920817.1 uncharacterized protein LOC107449709 isoform X2 [Parasteatoda tepidariorum]XP_015920818.1 uncharacterized protein LOC107449709 isoform X2 [Parasteatoda tepidariorum]XP_015920819.1 uncharacterized protein LOC107449709 isoform X2 [Parasteatoda tepidariorum]XP_042895724.1 uncharacterized protein LOC107449709 isoform X1 [Parasteatoda tepidariorum]
MSDLVYSVRVMQREDVPEALDVWRETQLQEGTQCLYTWMGVDPEAFQVAVTESGEVIGVCGGVIHHEDLAFVGIYAVREKYRGSGIGYKVWNACMEHIGSRNACLNAVPEKFELYRDRGGFPLVETEWTCVVNETSGNETVNPEVLSDVVPKGVDIHPFDESLLPFIYDYDYSLIGYKRNVAVELSCKEKDSRTLVAMKEGACVGWGTIKLSCQNVGLIGPLYADEADVAEVMLRRLISDFPLSKGFSMMTISSNTAANQMVKKLCVPTLEECPRLYRKHKLKVDVNKVFGHFDLNFSPF